MNQRGGQHGRPGIAMVMVLGAVAIVFVIGMSLLSGLPATAHASSNMIDRDAAVFLAESGLTEALYRMQNPPDGEDVWSGVTGRTVAGMNGTYDVSIADEGDGVYLMTATGRMTGRRGQALTHTVQMRVLVVEGGGYVMKHAAVFAAAAALPLGGRVYGDLHVNNSLLNLGRVDGTVSVVGTLRGFGRADTVIEGADAVEMPQVDFDSYLTYQHNGQTYTADVYSDSGDLTGNIRPVDDDNPLGVVVFDGDLSLERNLRLKNGMLVVRGDVELNGKRLRVDGESNRASLLVDGDVAFNQRNSRLKVREGLTYINGDVSARLSARNSKLDVRGGLIVTEGLPILFPGSFDVRYSGLDSSASVSLNLSGGGGGGGGGSQRSVTPLGYTDAPSAY